MAEILATLGTANWGPILLACALVAFVSLLYRLAERKRRRRSHSQPPGYSARPVQLVEQSMASIISQLQILDPDQLREEVIKAGIKCGPITSTTRFIFEKKLARVLGQHGGLETSTLSDGTTAASQTQQTQSSEDGEFGYGVGLNPPTEETESSLVEINGRLLDDGQKCITPSKDPPLYYAVCPVYEDTLSRNEKVHIYADKKEALQVVKMLKGSRFKAFVSKDDAEKFARGICDYCPSPSKISMALSPVKNSQGIVRDGSNSLEAEIINKEKANSFKCPRTQDLTAKLRKAVEKGDLACFSDLIWSNPRYLIGSGDNPTVVQEGCRYNVMHVAAKENQDKICHLVLETLENPEFMRLMYPDDDDDMLQKRIQYIVDLYLNTPDKMGFDTPLHFACKFGNADVVNILCSHPKIIKKPRNKYDQTPEEVICERSKNKSAELKTQMKEYLKGHYYVPLLRAEDNVSSPVIGTPWSPEQPDIISTARFSGSPKDPLLAVRAFAGPMSPSKAEDFRKIWKTPPREKAGYYHKVRKTDPERGTERVGRELAHELGVPWVEYWDFLGCFIDLSSKEGLKKLEKYLANRETSDGLYLDSEYEYCNKYKTPPSGKSKKTCNSISVGAFLDDEEDMSLEEIKNRQNAALKHGSSQAETIAIPKCIMETPAITSSTHQNESNCAFSSPECNNRFLPKEKRQPNSKEGMLSPISNLMSEFEKMFVSEKEDIDSENWQINNLASKELAVKDGPSHQAIYKETENADSSNTTDGTVLSKVEQLFPELSLQEPLSPPQSNTGLSLLCASSESPQMCLKTTPRNQSTRKVFLLGEEPCKLDSDVLSAVENIEIDGHHYPCVSKWKKAVLSYTNTDRQSWPSPAALSGRGKFQMLSSVSPGNFAFSTPGRSSPIRGSPGKYMNTSDYGSPGRYSPAYASHIQLLRVRHFSEHAAL
ncbi:hypothetical protein GDO86_001957 [Hymenochirus boettgeri]|uniref:Ankyrin repeat and LEM domain-containing protein 2 n=1 Tax=Hymenochirus boettgeri TaxID=247094 RepID=A0A8T2KN39_9PIPI|nr:hypothetical protein GDO86_001957 [Hymenochirus boettgeri]